MPYKKKYRKQSNSNRYMNTAQRALTTGAAALALARQLKGLINVEHHRHIVTTSSTSITDSGSVIPLHLITQGDDKADRSGNSIMCKYINSAFTFKVHGSSATTSVIRCIYFIDLQQIGDTTPSVTDVLESASVTAPLNRNTVGRFKILKQYYINLQPGSHEGQIKKQYIPLGNHHVRYNGSLTTDIQKGGLYRLLIADQTVNYPNHSGDEIVMFIDN